LDALSTYYGPGNTGLATIIPTGTQMQKFQQLTVLAQLKGQKEEQERAAAAKQQEELSRQFKDAMDKHISVNYHPYRKANYDMRFKAQQQHISALNKYGANIPAEEKAKIANTWSDLQRKKTAIDAVEQQVNTALTSFDKDSSIDKTAFANALSKKFVDEKGGMVDPNEVDVYQMIEDLKQDHTVYNKEKVIKAFIDQVKSTELNVVKHGRDTREEIGIKYRFLDVDPETGMQRYDENGLPAIQSTPEVVDVFKSIEGGEPFIRAIVQEMYDQGFEGTIGEAEQAAIKPILASYAQYATTKRNVENQPTGNTGATERQQNASERFNSIVRAVEGDSTELSRMVGRKTSYGVISDIEPSQNFQSFNITFTKETTVAGNKDTEEVTRNFDIHNAEDGDAIMAIFNQALSEESGQKIPWEELRKYNDEYRKTATQRRRGGQQQEQANPNDRLGIL